MSYRTIPPTEVLESLVRVSNDDVNDFKTVNLQEPLLIINRNDDDDISIDDMEYGDNVTSNNKNNSNKRFLRNGKVIKAFAIISGSIVALASQLILYITMWNDNVLNRPTSSVVLFSFAWSFWTCLIVFSCMTYIARSCSNYPTTMIKNDADTKITSNDEEKLDAYEDRVFQVEAHYIVGALLSISGIWLINDLFQAKNRIAEKALHIHPMLTVLSAAVAYGLFVRWIVVRKNNMDTYKDTDDNCIDYECQSYHSKKLNMLAPTFQMISATLGAIIGLCSQFILSMILWQDNMTKPLISSVVCFSLIWSFVTVLITLAGCTSLRIMLSSSTTLKNEIMSTNEQIQLNRVTLRMEAAYVSSSLVGICTAWIIIDILTNMTDQILPNVFMLLISLAGFRTIIICIPEEQCMYQQIDTSTKSIVEVA